jgi:hypothetical protein
MRSHISTELVPDQLQKIYITGSDAHLGTAYGPKHCICTECEAKVFLREVEEMTGKRR